jgi:hypothetical protein
VDVYPGPKVNFKSQFVFTVTKYTNLSSINLRRIESECG